MTNEIIVEIEDDFKFLEEYDKRWNAFVASMIKLDEILSPLWRVINKVYKRVYKGYPCYPSFSFLRFFIFIWRREVYNMCKESIEDNLIKILAKFHSGWLNYWIQETKKRKAKEANSLPQNLNISNKNRLANMKSPAFPFDWKAKLNSNCLKLNGWNAFVADQYNEVDSVLGLVYKEIETKLPKFCSKEKDVFWQLLTDVVDLSMNEYSVHFIKHSENDYMAPYTDLSDKIKKELLRFYIKTIKSTPFKLWSEVIDEHWKILSSIFPVALQKELHEQRLSFVKKYTKERVKFQTKRFLEKTIHKKVWNNNSEDNKQYKSTTYCDPTMLTEEEWLEINIAGLKTTSFYEYLTSWVKEQNLNTEILLSYIKENEVDMINIFNVNTEINNSFKSNVELKNTEVYRYKNERGFPFKLSQHEAFLYSFDNEISISYIEKIRTEIHPKIKTNKPMLKMTKTVSRSSWTKDIFDIGEELASELEFSKLEASVTEKRSTTSKSVFDFINELDQKDVNMEIENSGNERSEEQKSEEQRLSCMKPIMRNTTFQTKSKLEPWPFQKVDNEFSFGDRRSYIEQARSSLLSSNMLSLIDEDNIDEDVEMIDIPALPKFWK